MFPVGFHKFHPNPFLNYQLNRWYSLGNITKEDIDSIASKIHNFGDYINEFGKACELAKRENRIENAAYYARAKEFLLDPENGSKIPVYEEFTDLFDRAFENEPYERNEVPYAHGHLSSMRFPSRTGQTKGTIIACGGFDSLMEEFYAIWKFFTENGYEVIVFEGPGQGGTLRRSGLRFDHDWEKPVSTILTYYEINDATAIGISMGGYWMMRAAAFEKRIKRVVSWSPVYDWMELTTPFNRKLVKHLMKYRKLMNFLIRLKMNVGLIRHTVLNAMFIQGRTQPIYAVEWFLGMNKDHLNSELIDQDVLLLAGEEDAFQPPLLLQKQKEALVNARSVTEKIFTESEHAAQHCQIGNLNLPLETILTWINEKTQSKENHNKRNLSLS